MLSLLDTYCSNLNINSYTGGFFSPRPEEPWQLPVPKRFGQHKFYYVTNGQCVINIEETEYLAGPGDWFLIPAGTIHSYYKVDGTPFQKYWMHFEIFPGNDLFKQLNLPYHIHIGDHTKVRQLFEAYTQATRSPHLTSYFIIKAACFELLAEYINIAKPEEVLVENRSNQKLNDVMVYINDNLDKNLSVEELAALVYMHPNHFIRFFKEKTGYTPARFINMKKMEKAKHLLENTELSIMEIMVQMGIEDASHFSKAFKTHYSMSPRKYREFFRANLKYGGPVM